MSTIPAFWVLSLATWLSFSKLSSLSRAVISQKKKVHIKDYPKECLMQDSDNQNQDTRISILSTHCIKQEQPHCSTLPASLYKPKTCHQTSTTLGACTIKSLYQSIYFKWNNIVLSGYLDCSTLVGVSCSRHQHAKHLENSPVTTCQASFYLPVRSAGVCKMKVPQNS